MELVFLQSDACGARKSKQPMSFGIRQGMGASPLPLEYYFYPKY